MYYLRCLGTPALERDGTEVRFSRKKSLALLAYLAVTRQPESRDKLAALLWPDQPPGPAYGYLRTALYDINTVCPEGFVDGDGLSVRLADYISLDVDVWKFRELAGARRRRPASRADLAAAVELYRGTFLSGFSLKDAPPFEDWQRECGEELTQACEEAIRELIRTCVDEGDTAEALALAKRLVAMDELDESYHRMLMSLEAIAGKPVAVDLAWQRCCRIMKRELDAQPAEETRRLYDRLRSTRGETVDQRVLRELLGGLLGGAVPSLSAGVPSRAAGPAGATPAATASPPSEHAPIAVAVDVLGRIYFTDMRRHRVVRIDDMTGRGAVAFGSEGMGEGQFMAPGPLWLDSRGRIYVADPCLDRICRFDDMDGRGWVSLGTTGSGERCFNAPSGGCVDSRGRVYVADSLNNRVVRFDDMEGSGWTTCGGPWPEEGPGRFNRPDAIAVDPSGWIYVSIHPAAIVRMDDMDGSGWTLIRPANLRLNQVRYTAGIAVDHEKNQLYLVTGSWVIRLAGLTGLRWTALGGRPGSSRTDPLRGDTVSYPGQISLDAKHRLYVVDHTIARIVRVDDIYGTGWVEFPPRAAARGEGGP